MTTNETTSKQDSLSVAHTTVVIRCDEFLEYVFYQIALYLKDVRPHHRSVVWKAFSALEFIWNNPLFSLYKSKKGLKWIRVFLKEIQNTESNRPMCIFFGSGIARAVEDICNFTYWRYHEWPKHEAIEFEEAYELAQLLCNSFSDKLNKLFWNEYHGVAYYAFEHAMFYHLTHDMSEKIILVSERYLPRSFNYQPHAIEHRCFNADVVTNTLATTKRTLICQLKKIRCSFSCIVSNLYNAMHGIKNAYSAYHKSQGAIYIIAEGGAVNSISAIAAAKDLKRNGERVIVLSTTRYIFKQAIKASIEAMLIPLAFFNPDNSNELNETFESFLSEISNFLLPNPSAKQLSFFERLASVLESWYYRQTAISRTIKEQFLQCPPKALLSIGEGTTLALISSEEGKQYQTPWIAWNAILIMESPDNCFFPADHHLFYGEHGLNIAIKAGCPKDKSALVGSSVYDSSVDYIPTSKRINKLLKNADGRLVVTIGTENRLGQMREIEPSLKELLLIDGIYIVIKLHPDDRKEEFEKLINSLPNQHRKKVLIIKRCNILDLLYVSSLLISMYSNIIVNAAIIGTPVLVYDFYNTRPLDFIGCKIARGAFSVSEFSVVARKLLFDKQYIDETKQQAKKYIQFINFACDGQSAKRVARYVLNVIDSADRSCTGGNPVAVGTTLSDGPPHRSQRAELPH